MAWLEAEAHGMLKTADGLNGQVRDLMKVVRAAASSSPPVRISGDWQDGVAKSKQKPKKRVLVSEVDSEVPGRDRSPLQRRIPRA